MESAWGKAKINLEEIILTNKPIYAHAKDNAVKESLWEHTNLCEKYFYKLMNKKKMSDSIRELACVMLKEMPECAYTWFEQALQGIITFHDTGKINPLFQAVKMGNKELEGMQLHSVDSANHSELSAAIYLDYFLAEAEKMSLGKEEKVRIYQILLINAYLISRHHSSLIHYKKFLTELEDSGSIFKIWEGMDQGEYCRLYKGRFSHLKSSAVTYRIRKIAYKQTEQQKFAEFIYARLLLSLLTACDYYATNEYMNGTETTYFGSAEEIKEIKKFYDDTPLIRTIREFQKKETEDDGRNINYLRNCMFQEAEENLIKKKDGALFFLEAPTGSGKSNIAMNCSFRLLEEDMDKIIYVYPFNNLVEQNKASLEAIFTNTDIYKKIAIINSITPIEAEKKEAEKENKDENPSYYAKALLDRQFLNYPFILTTHVSLFQTMFGTEREAVFGFHQLIGSVIVLDEIQSYKNTIWTEIIKFLQMCGKFLHCKVLIMSATLPDFELLIGKNENIVRLITNRDKYFSDPRFRNRVKISYELLREKLTIDILYGHVKQNMASKKKIMIEFIKKDMAYEFYDRLCGDEEITIPVERMTGDDNSVDREEILKKAKDEKFCKDGFLMVATQVVEAGIDIDMDIGYKDISFLDSEEQFLGRINRNCKRDGIVYFFNLCNAASIYRQDYRMNRQFTLENQEMQQVLETKRFELYYGPVLEMLKREWNASESKEGIGHFINEEIGGLDFEAVEKRMQLITDDNWDMSVYLARTIENYHGKRVDGTQVWEEYKKILLAPPADYAEFRIKLSEIRSLMNLFIYRIKKNSNLLYHDRIGELYYLENGGDYFENGRLNKNKLMQEGALFLEL